MLFLIHKVLTIFHLLMKILSSFSSSLKKKNNILLTNLNMEMKRKFSKLSQYLEMHYLIVGQLKISKYLTKMIFVQRQD